MSHLSTANFRFRPLTREGKPKSLFVRDGRITGEGLSLDHDLGNVFFEDIYKVEVYRRNLVVVLYPFATVSQGVTDLIINGTNSFVLRLYSGGEEYVKRHIDQWVSRLRLQKEREKHPDTFEYRKKFVTGHCPNCNSLVDLTEKPPSHYIFCPYCQSIYNHHRKLLAEDPRYKTCPETGYYDKVGDYVEYKYYYVGREVKLQKRTHYCGEAYSDILFDQTFAKNLTFVFGSLTALWQRHRMKRNTHPDYLELAKANRLALEGKASDADVVYSSMLTRIMDHPGLHLNMGLAYYEAGNVDRAAQHFRKSLEACSNYQPVFDTLVKYKIRLRASEMVREQEWEQEVKKIEEQIEMLRS